MASDFGRGARGDGRRKARTRRVRGKAGARSLYGNGRGSTSGVGAQAPAVVAPGRWRGEGGWGGEVNMTKDTCIILIVARNTT